MATNLKRSVTFTSVSSSSLSRLRCSYSACRFHTFSSITTTSLSVPRLQPNSYMTESFTWVFSNTISQQHARMMHDEKRITVITAIILTKLKPLITFTPLNAHLPISQNNPFKVREFLGVVYGVGPKGSKVHDVLLNQSWSRREIFGVGLPPWSRVGPQQIYRLPLRSKHNNSYY